MSPEHRVILERMRSSAGVVRRVVEDAPPGRFGRAPREGEWSALETLTHLRDVIVHVYGLRIRRLLYEDAPVFGDFDEEGYRRASPGPGPSSLARCHVDRAPRPAGGRARRGARGADRRGRGRHRSRGEIADAWI